MKTPTITDLSTLIRLLKEGICIEYRAFEEDQEAGIQLTIGWDPQTGNWSYQTGDNSFSGDAYSYPIWGVAGIYRDSNPRAVARALIDEMEEQAYQ